MMAAKKGVALTDDMSIEELRAGLNNAFGPGTVMLASEMPDQQYWPTGVLPIDVALDGGLPVGRFTTFIGDFSTLKSLAAYMALIQCQQRGGKGALVDTEHAFDPAWFKALGGDVNQLLVQRPATGEEAVAVMEVLLKRKLDLIVWDSIAATQTAQYAEKKSGDDTQVADQARMMSKALRRLNSVNTKTAVLCINQTRVNVGMTYGPTDTAPGGKAMGFYSSLTLRFTKSGKTMEEVDQWTGEKMEKKKQRVKQQIKVTVEKWKLNAPVREVYFDFDLKLGRVDEVGYMLAWAIEQGYVEINSASWYSMSDIKINGRQKFFDTIAQEEDLTQWMRNELTKGFSLASGGSPAKAQASTVARPKRKNSKGVA